MTAENIYLTKIAADQPKKTSTEATFFASEGLGMAAGLAGTVLGGRLGSMKAGKALAKSKPAQWIGKKLFGHGADITGTHLGSEIGAHVVGGVGSYAGMKAIAKHDESKQNKYLQKAACLLDYRH